MNNKHLLPINHVDLSFCFKKDLKKQKILQRSKSGKEFSLVSFNTIYIYLYIYIMLIITKIQEQQKEIVKYEKK